MALPEQIKKQSEEVQKLYAELNSDPEASNEEGNVGVDNSEQTTDDDKEVSKSAEVVPDEDKEKAPPIEVSPDEVEGEGYKQKYRTLQGMYNREIPRLRNENRQMAGRLQQMEQLMATMQSQAEQAQEQPAPTKPLVSDDEVEEYGADTVDLFRRLARQETQPYLDKIAHLQDTIKQLQTNVVPQVENVAKHQQQTTQERFWSDLEREVPDWREVNNNQDFHTWLLEYDPLSGTTRQDMLEQAQSQFDSRRVVSFFNTWKQLNQSHGEQQKTKNSSKEELEKQIQPGKARSAPTPTTSEGRTYTPQDIQQFFKDVSMGKYKGREEERNRIERDIFAAQQQGRIAANG